jgi:pimeloyl-ACP methyl ester carboxylesterase
MIRRGYVESRYGQLHYRAAGQSVAGGPRPLLLLHQNPASSFEYEGLITAMATDRRVVAVDTPGYGMSDGADRPLDMAECAACFAGALESLGFDDATGVDVYGFHTGALMAAELAIAVPETVRRVILTGLPMRAAAERSERLAQARNAPKLDEAGEVALGMASGLWHYVVGARTAGVPLDRAARQWVDKLRTLDRSSWAYIGVWGYAYEDRLPRIGQPVLLLQPHEDLLEESKAAARLIPDHTIVELPRFDRDIFDLPEAVDAIGTQMRAFLDFPGSSGETA